METTGQYTKKPGYYERSAELAEAASRLDEFAGVRKETYALLYDNLPASVQVLKDLQSTASEAVRLNAAKHILALAEIGPGPVNPASLPLELKITSNQVDKIAEAKALMEDSGE